jgi:phenylalanyl-tRNA synthetase beta chain
VSKRNVSKRDGGWEVNAPPWRPDLVDPSDCVEEILRLFGYDRIPAVLPAAPAGFGRTGLQRLRRLVGLGLSGAGVTEVLTYPFVGDSDHDGLRLAPNDARRRVPLLANPLSDESPHLRSTLLPGLLGVVRRNRGRGIDDVAVWELGRVFCLRDDQRPEGVADPVRPSTAHRPTEAEVVALEALLPAQPEHVAAVWSGAIERGGWWGSARPVTWADAVDHAAQVVAASGAQVEISQGVDAPFHPGRTAILCVAGERIGVAGEVHPGVCSAFGVPPRTVAFEIDLTALAGYASAAVAPDFSVAPLAKEDLALVVASDVPAGAVAHTLRAAGGALVEDVRLFDVYVGDQVPAGYRSLAFALRLRAPDRTLTPEEIATVRSACIEAATRQHGARLR